MTQSQHENCRISHAMVTLTPAAHLSLCVSLPGVSASCVTGSALPSLSTAPSTDSVQLVITSQKFSANDSCGQTSIADEKLWKMRRHFSPRLLMQRLSRHRPADCEPSSPWCGARSPGCLWRWRRRSERWAQTRLEGREGRKRA
ncbi:hypothetical protein E2C01_050842 [Portunus trituberculatus]|uniref:Uncharacterized protein n=1 Tax=Portunus trituberculatus TaxID=210409 RepID=A0A5B7GH24_PORTR|nr:hypothetical protein [Portunus trituberculatus]